MASGDILNFTENVIENVKNFTVRYDMSHPQYKNFRIKNKKWDEIANILNIEGVDGDDLRKKWKILRDNYEKHLRSEKTRTGQERKVLCRYKAWPWTREMEPFRPFIGFAQTHSNISNPDTPLDPSQGSDNENDTNNEADTSAVQAIPSPISVDSVPIEKDKETTEIPCATGSYGIKKRKISENIRSPPSTGVEKIINFLEKRQSATAQREESDEIDKIFHGYAPAVKKITPRRQTIIKYRIAKLLMDAELEQQMDMENEATNRTTQGNLATSSNNNISYSNSNIGTPQYYSNPPSVPQTESSHSAQSWYENFGDSAIP